MSQQCGNCKWWDITAGIGDQHECLYFYKIYEMKFPSCINKQDITPELMESQEGQNCPVYEERKE